MAFTSGFSLGMLWAGIVIDQFGLTALVVGAAIASHERGYAVSIDNST